MGDGDDILQQRREQRLATLSLAEQVAEERWREPLLPGERTLHALLSHLLGWDEWSIAVFELSALRPLPPTLSRALDEVDAFNARAVTRFSGLTRDDLLVGLQTAVERVCTAATIAGGDDWAKRRIADLARPQAADSATPSRGPRVGSLLRVLLEHEVEHAGEISATFGVLPNVEQFRSGDGQKE